LVLQDLVENSTFPITASSTQAYAGSSLFRVASYSVPIYPGASYSVISQQDLENPALQRPFPADPTVPGAVSRFALGASAWVNGFPTLQATPLAIKPQASSGFGRELSVQVSIGNGPVYETKPATQQPDGTWKATLDLAQETTTAIDL